MLDWHEGAKIRRSGLTDVYLAELQQSPYISGFLTSAQLSHSPSVFDATWYTASAFAGEQFLLVGDAGLFIDPLSSEGVHKAMASAITGAIVINTMLKRPWMTPHAVRFYNESQQATYETHYQQSVRYYGEEQRWPEQPFWQKRSLREDHSPEATQPLIPSPQSAIRLPPPSGGNPQRVSTLRIAPGVIIEQRPVIEGSYIELRDVIVAPPYPRGVRFLQQVHLPRLLAIVRQRSAVGDIMTLYLATTEGKNCSPETVRQTLARLYQEKILASADVTETG
jgi:hypothetical protein